MTRSEIIWLVNEIKPKYFKSNKFFEQRMSDFKKMPRFDILYAQNFHNGNFMGYSYVGFYNEKFVSGGLSVYDVQECNGRIYDLIIERSKENGMD